MVNSSGVHTNLRRSIINSNFKNMDSNNEIILEKNSN